MLARLLIGSALALTASSAHAAWHVAESKHFVVYADDSAKDTQAYAETLETFDSAVRLTTVLKEEAISPSNRVTVFLVDDIGDLRRLAGMGANSGIAGFYSGRASGSYAFAPRRTDGGGQFSLDPRSVLQHEYAHHLMLGTYSGAIPAWLIEGWAEFFATTRPERNGDVTVGAPPLYRAWTLTQGPQLSLKTMLSGGYDELRGDQLESLYGRGWLLTHYLLFEDMTKGPRAGQLSTYLREMNGGATGADAAIKAFGSLKDLERDLGKQLRASRISSLRYKPDMLRPSPVTVRALRPGEAAILPIRMRSKRGVDEESAPKVLADARRVAAQHGDDPLVQLTLAEAEHDVGNLEAALAAATRAVALDPKAVEGFIYQGRARLAMLARDGGDAAAWDAARKPILAANALENDDAEPLMLYYQSFAMADERPSPNAVAALMQSQALAPQDTGLRLMAAHQLLVDGEGARARRMLGPVAFNPHGGALAILGRALVERLDADGPAAALAFMEQARGQIEAAEEQD